MEPLSPNPSFKMESQVIFHFALPPHAASSSLHFTFDDLMRQAAFASVCISISLKCQNQLWKQWLVCMGLNSWEIWYISFSFEGVVGGNLPVTGTEAHGQSTPVPPNIYNQILFIAIKQLLSSWTNCLFLWHYFGISSGCRS